MEVRWDFVCSFKVVYIRYTTGPLYLGGRGLTMLVGLKTVCFTWSGFYFLHCPFDVGFFSCRSFGSPWWRSLSSTLRAWRLPSGTPGWTCGFRTAPWWGSAARCIGHRE